MPKYEFEVKQTRTVMCRYVVEARNPKEAEEKCERGDYIQCDQFNASEELVDSAITKGPTVIT